MKEITQKDVVMAMDTMIYKSGLIKSNPASYESNQHILSGTATSVKMRGNLTLFDNGAHTFAPSVSTNTPKFQTIYTTKHGVVRETKEDLIMIVRLPKRLGKLRLCALHYEVSGLLHKFLKTLKW